MIEKNISFNKNVYFIKFILNFKLSYKSLILKDEQS